MPTQPHHDETGEQRPPAPEAPRASNDIRRALDTLERQRSDIITRIHDLRLPTSAPEYQDLRQIHHAQQTLRRRYVADHPEAAAEIAQEYDHLDAEPYAASAVRDVVVGGALGGAISGVGLGYGIPAAVTTGVEVSSAANTATGFTGLFAWPGGPSALLSTGGMLLGLPLVGAALGYWKNGLKGASVGFGVGSAINMGFMVAGGSSLAATWPLVAGSALAVGGVYAAGKVGKHLWNWFWSRRRR